MAAIVGEFAICPVIGHSGRTSMSMKTCAVGNRRHRQLQQHDRLVQTKKNPA